MIYTSGEHAIESPVYPSALRVDFYCRHRPGGRLPDLWKPYLCNRLMDFPRSKFCKIVQDCSCALAWPLPICPIWACPCATTFVKFARNWVQTLRNAYLWNCWIGVTPFKIPWTCLAPYGLAHGPQTSCQISTWARLCGTHISDTAGWIYTAWSFVELSRPVVVQHHGH